MTGLSVFASLALIYCPFQFLMQIDKTGFNACQFDANKLSKRWNIYYAAMNEADWKKYGGKSGVCGRCLKVKGVKGETTEGHKRRPIIVKIVDLCPEWACPKKEGHNIDFSTTALEAITGYDWDKKLIDWEFTSCSKKAWTKQQLQSLKKFKDTRKGKSKKDNCSKSKNSCKKAKKNKGSN